MVRIQGEDYNIRQLLIGEYDYGPMCTPSNPFSRKPRDPPQLFKVREFMPLLLAAIMGLQHALAMIGGLITPPLLVAQISGDIGLQQYQISASLIVSGIATIIQVTQFSIPFTKLKYGTGIISVIGTSFTFLPLTQSAIKTMMAGGDDYRTAYGRILGTIMVCSWIVVAFSFVPPRFLRAIFPPIVTGATIFLIGAALIRTGFQYWGGGAFCASYVDSGLTPIKYSACLTPSLSGQLTNTTNACYGPTIFPACTDNGDVKLPFGSPQYLALGALVFLILVIIEVFGSPFMRNAEVVIALLLGYLVSACITTKGSRYVTSAKFSRAKWITFLWVEHYNYGFYAPAVIPFCVSFLVVVVEAVGDITATAEASEISTEGPEHQQRIQGGLLADGFNSFWGALATNLPNTTFAQNNGVIALTRCASRYAGWACGGWLLLLGVIGKFAAFVTSIPACVLGGMTTFLFANVCMSGIRIMTMHGLTRKDRFIGAVAIGLGLGTTMVPSWSQKNLWNLSSSANGGVHGVRDAVLEILGNAFAIGCLAAVVLNQIIPNEKKFVPEMQPAVKMDPNPNPKEQFAQEYPNPAYTHHPDQHSHGKYDDSAHDKPAVAPGVQQV